MSDREKKLLSLFLVAGFLVLNFLGYSYYQTTSLAVKAKHDKAERELRTARIIQASGQEIIDQMEWLRDHEPAPTDAQDAQVKLYKFCIQAASLNGLVFDEKDAELLAHDEEPGNHYQRAKVLIKVTGPEPAVYSWLHQINVPAELRHATRLEMKPNAKDDTQIDCAATIEQWFVPMPPA